MEKTISELLTFQVALKANLSIVTGMDYAMVKFSLSEMLAFVSDEAIQIYGGMGLMSDLPLEQIW